jgi:hypothetical protein
MYITIKFKDSEATHKINVADNFIRDEKDKILSWDRQAAKAKEIAHDMYGSKVQSVELVKN